MKKISFALGLILLTFLSCKEKKYTEVTKMKQSVNRPNIILILADDLGFADLGCTGSDLYQTPNIDKLASESMYFSKAHASHATCQPSRISLITGKTPGRLGAVSHGSLRDVKGHGIEMGQNEVTIGNALQEGGYTTAHFGKWHIGTGENGPRNRGFDVDVGSNDFCCPGSYFYPYKSNYYKNEKDIKAAVPDLEGYSSEDHLTKALSNEVSKFISEQKNSDKPFFINLWYYAVHTPLQAEKDKVQKYKDLVTPNHKHKNATYASLVEHLDEGVGKVLKTIEDNGMADNTIVIFMSDNGGALFNNITINYPLRGGKGMFYEGGTRVPMFVRWPGVVKPGSTSDERVVGWDLYPTILSMAGVDGDAEHNKQLDGDDLTPLLKDPNLHFKDREFHWLKYVSLIHFTNTTERNWPGGSIIKDDWKLIEYFNMPQDPNRHQFMLFNLAEDPSETTNQAEKYPEKTEELKKRMYRWREDMNTPKFDMEKLYGEAYRKSLKKN